MSATGSAAPQVPDPYELARADAAVLAERTGVERHDVFLVLGSGWASAVGALGAPAAAVPVGALAGFARPGVAGHGDELRSVAVGDRHVLISAGRVHAYEGHDLATVVHGVRTAVAAGCRTVVLTNAAGGIAEDLTPGQVVLISDQLNLTGRSPLSGAAPTDGTRFADMSDAYSARLRAAAREAVPWLAEGVYAGVSGPQYETPAEVRMLWRLGADLVGMSTVHETIVAVHLGAEVLGLSLVTNLAGGLGGPVRHGEVLEVAERSAGQLADVLTAVVPRL